MIRRTKMIMMLIGLLAFFILSPSLAAASGESFYSFAEYEKLISGDQTMRSLSDDVERFQRAPLYLRISYIQLLADRCADDGPCKTDDFIYRLGAHDLSTVGGRAAWVLERVSGTKLEVLGANPDAERRIRLKEAARLVQLAYGNGVVAGVALQSKASDKEVLTAAYRGRLSERDPARSSGVMAEFLERWFPIGKRAADLADILGAAGKETKSGIRYKFDDGLGGCVFEFAVSEGVITSVVVISIY